MPRGKAKAFEYFKKLNIALTDQEKEKIEVADFGLSDLYNVGLQILTYINTERVCAKELVLFPYQTCPEHRHVDSDVSKGKEETFRCRYGTVYLYVEGDPAKQIRARKFWKTEDEVSVFHEIVLKPGEQYTLHPNTKTLVSGWARRSSRVGVFNKKLRRDRYLHRQEDKEDFRSKMISQ